MTTSCITPAEGLVHAVAVAINTAWFPPPPSANHADQNETTHKDQFQAIYEEIKRFLRHALFTPLRTQSAEEVVASLRNLNFIYTYTPSPEDKNGQAWHSKLEFELIRPNDMVRKARDTVLLVLVDGRWPQDDSKEHSPDKIKVDAMVTIRKWKCATPPAKWPDVFNFDWCKEHGGETGKVVFVKDDVVFVDLGGKAQPLPKIAVEPAWRVLLAYDADQKELDKGVVLLTHAHVKEKFHVKPNEAGTLFRESLRGIFTIQTKEPTEDEVYCKNQKLQGHHARSTDEWKLSDTTADGHLPNRDDSCCVVKDCQTILKHHWKHFCDNDLVADLDSPWKLTGRLAGFFNAARADPEVQLIVVVIGAIAGSGFKPKDLFVQSSGSINWAFSTLKKLWKKEIGGDDDDFHNAWISLYLQSGCILAKGAVDRLRGTLGDAVTNKQFNDEQGKISETIGKLRECSGESKGCLVLDPSGAVTAVGVKFKYVDANVQREAARQGAEILKELKTTGNMSPWTVLELSNGEMSMHTPGFEKGKGTRQTYLQRR